MKNFSGRFACLLCITPILLATGCVTILGGGKKAAFEITSDPPGAEVYDQNRLRMGTTPFTFSEMHERKLDLTIQKTGFEDEPLVLRRHSKSGLLFLDAMLLCIPCIVDLPQPTMLYSIEGPAGTVRLRKKLKEYDKALPVVINPIEITLDKQQEVGKINGLKKSMSAGNIEKITGYPDFFDGSVFESLQKGFFKPSYAKSSRKSEGIIRPRISITVSIRDFHFDLKGSSVRDYTGPCSMKTEWQIYRYSEAVGDKKDNPVATFSIVTSTFRKSGTDEYVIPDLLFQAGRDFMEIDTLYEFLSKISAESVLAQKGETIKVKGSVLNRTSLPSKDRFKNAIKAVVTIKGSRGFGSGFVISSDGYIVTNYHVVEDEKNLSVSMNQNISLQADIVKVNPEYDLALLKLSATDLVALPFANSDPAEVGDEVYAVGTPSDLDLGQSLTKGIISGKRILEDVSYIQSDVSISPGNSGGPLLNDLGQVIGVTSMKMVGKGIEGVCFSIPSNVVLEMLNITLE